MIADFSVIYTGPGSLRGPPTATVPEDFMATPRYQLPLRVFEQPVRNPSTLEDVKRNQEASTPLENGQRTVKGRNPDEVLKKARALLEDDGRMIRSLSLGPNGVTAVVYAPEEKKDPRTMSENRKRKGYR